MKNSEEFTNVNIMYPLLYIFQQSYMEDLSMSRSKSESSFSKSKMLNLDLIAPKVKFINPRKSKNENEIK